METAEAKDSKAAKEWSIRILEREREREREFSAGAGTGNGLNRTLEVIWNLL